MTTDTLSPPPQTDSPTRTAPVPPGYTTLERGGAYFRALGPLYQRRGEDGSIVIALRVNEDHANVIGVAHGGMLLTFADSAMGINLHTSADGDRMKQSAVTTTLSSEFLSAAKMGEWLEAHTRIRRRGKRMMFVDCTLMVGEREVLHASGTFLPI
jgi:uncharacterized protein (TIGR00369 family)